MTPTLPLAFAAGVLSFLSPCVLPLVPSYLAYVGGRAAGTGDPDELPAPRRKLLGNSLMFVLGFALVFVALGASASALGALLRAWRGSLIVVGGVLVIGFGLMMLGVLRVPGATRDVRFRFGGDGATPWGALLMGMAFAAGWTPCIGPVLGGILTMAGASGTLLSGVVLLGTYALGLAVPFLLAALALEPFLRFSARFRRFLPWVERAAGGLLVVAGVMMVSGTYTRLNSYLIRFTPEWLYSRL